MNAPVVYIITKLELGGAQKVCLSLFNQLGQQRTTYLISGTQGVLVDQVKDNAQALLLPSFTREVGLLSLLAEVRNFFILTKTLRSLKKKHPDLMVHTHSTKAGIIGRWAALFAGVKQRIHTIHGFAFHAHQSRIKTAILYLAELATSGITTHFVCVSTKDALVGKKYFPRFHKKHSLIRASVDRLPFITEQKNTTDGLHIFGTIACFKPQKNLTDLIHAFAKVHAQQPNTRLEIIGDGILRPQLTALITTYQLNDVVTLHGWQHHVAPFMARWHAFVLSSLWEGLPCAIIEARLMKLPVISYDTGGVSEVIQSGKNGFICAQKQWQKLADAMIALSAEPETYHRLQNYADDLVPFYQETMVQQHADLYNKL